MGLGREARAHGRLKVRQPLREAVVVAAGRERDAIERFEAIVLDELNVKAVRYVSEADELGQLRAQAQLPRAGPALRQAHAPGGRRGRRARRRARGAHAARGRPGARVRSTAASTPLGPDDVQLALQPLEGYQVERSGSHAVALDLTLDDELRREGLAREVVHAVQNARKEAGPATWRTASRWRSGGDEDLLEAVRAHEDYVTGETLATSLDLGDGENGARAADRGPRAAHRACGGPSQPRERAPPGSRRSCAGRARA